MKLSERKINVQAREDGAWVTDIPEFLDVELKVRGVGNKDWARMEQKLIAAVPRQRRSWPKPENARKTRDVCVLGPTRLW